MTIPAIKTAMAMQGQKTIFAFKAKHSGGSKGPKRPRPSRRLEVTNRGQWKRQLSLFPLSRMVSFDNGIPARASMTKLQSQARLVPSPCVVSGIILSGRAHGMAKHAGFPEPVPFSLRDTNHESMNQIHGFVQFGIVKLCFRRPGPLGGISALVTHLCP